MTDRDLPSEALPPSRGRVGSWFTDTFSSLDNPNYRLFFAGQVVSLSGTWMQSVAQAWLVLELTHSATWLGIAIALQFVPMLFLGPYGGLIIDRVNKRKLLIATQLAAAAQALTLGILTVTGVVNLPWVLGLSVTLGLITVLDNPGRQAFVREMVGADQVRNAVSLNSVLVNVSRAVGPALAGVLIATVGVGVCFLINAASFLAVILAYLLMNVSKLSPAERAGRSPGQVREGLRYVRGTPVLFIPLLMMALVGTLTYEFQVVLPPLATETFGGGARAYGMITAAMGIGAIIGGLASARRNTTGINPMIAAAVFFGVTDLLVAVSPTIVVAAIALVAVGAGSVWFISIGNSTLQLGSAPEMRGRVMALWAVAFLGSTPIGSPIIGWVVQQAGPRWALALGALAALAAAALGLIAQRRHTPLPEPAVR